MTDKVTLEEAQAELAPAATPAPTPAGRPPRNLWQSLGPFAIFVALFVVVAVLQPNFMGGGGLSILATQATPILLVALGQSAVLHVGSLDLSNAAMALLAAILVNIWIGIPFNMVILYGGLQEIPRELYEAAALDGAGPWRTFRSITLPMLRPVVTVVLVLGFMSTVKILDLILALTGGGPADLTHVLATLGIRYLRLDQVDMSMAAVVCAMPFVLPLVYVLMSRLSK